MKISTEAVAAWHASRRSHVDEKLDFSFYALDFFQANKPDFIESMNYVDIEISRLKHLNDQSTEDADQALI